MSVLDEYPKTNRQLHKRIHDVLTRVPGLEARDAGEYANSINDLADKACDLEEIFQRLLAGPATADDLADLLIAFELTLEQINGEFGCMDGKFYEMGDRLRPEGTEVQPD
jgi:hypothetical protein